jgi:signal recognition particle subunit SEC65
MYCPLMKRLFRANMEVPQNKKGWCYMKIAFNQQGKARKQMITIISEVLQEKHIYAGTPSYEYRVGGFTLDRNGTLIFDSATIQEEQLKMVLDALKTAGFTWQDSSSLEIGYPREGLTDEMITNIHKMVEAKAPLIKMALGIDELPIEATDTEIIFPWFRAGLSREETNAYAQFITQICKTVKEKKRVTAAVRDFSNPRFSFRVWLISLGMVGAEFSTARKILCKALPGNAAWSSGVDPRRKAKAEPDTGE